MHRLRELPLLVFPVAPVVHQASQQLRAVARVDPDLRKNELERCNALFNTEHWQNS